MVCGVLAGNFFFYLFILSFEKYKLNSDSWDKSYFEYLPKDPGEANVLFAKAAGHLDIGLVWHVTPGLMCLPHSRFRKTKL